MIGQKLYFKYYLEQNKVTMIYEDNNTEKNTFLVFYFCFCSRKSFVDFQEAVCDISFKRQNSECLNEGKLHTFILLLHERLSQYKDVL